MEIWSKSVAETAVVARDFLAKLVPDKNRAVIVGLHGELGSGKTTFVQSLALNLGIAEPVTSPTFVIEKIYNLKGLTLGNLKVSPWSQLIHLDAYRLESGAELLKLGFAELLADKRNLIIIEWAERVAEILGETKNIYFKFIDETTRQINFA